MTQEQILLQIHLNELGIKTIPEYRFDPERRFRFDLANPDLKMAFECNGTWNGLHGSRWSGSDMEKLNLAQAQGWTVFVFANEDVLSGKAKAFLQEHICGIAKEIA